MKPSASPNPASGPVLGLTWPILIARLCAFAGMTRSTAGAASAPMPAFTTLRRETAEMRLLKCISSGADILHPPLLSHYTPRPMYRVGKGAFFARRAHAAGTLRGGPWARRATLFVPADVVPLPTLSGGHSFTLPRRLEVPQHAGAQLDLLLQRPGAKALAGFHADLALRDELFQIRR